MLLDSHAGGVGGPGDDMVVQLGEDHQVCGEGGVDRESVTLLQSNLRGPPPKLPDSSFDSSGSGL